MKGKRQPPAFHDVNFTASEHGFERTVRFRADGKGHVIPGRCEDVVIAHPAYL